MAGLILKLKPREELMINGVVVENGDRKTQIRVKTEGAHILRLREAMRAEEATTPLKKAYFICQLAVTGQLPNAEAAEMIKASLLKTGADKADARICSITDLVANEEFYQAMRKIGEMKAEEE